MAGELRLIPLGELCDPQRGITYGIVKVGDFVSGGVPVIRGGDIRNGRIVFDNEKRVSKEVSQQFQRTILKGGEILINLIAEPGHTAIVPSELAGANVSRDVGVIPLSEAVDHRYVDYCLKSRMAVEWLTSRLQGSVTQKINLGILRDLPIPTPTVSKQRAIAHILGTLDEKIEVIWRMNETLEAMARALFKSWFVDFDPVRAKAERRDLNLPQPVADLFPDTFEDSDLGEIPKGWGAGCVDDEFDVTMGQSPPGNTYNEAGDGLPFYQGRTDFGLRFPTRRVYCTAPTRLAKQGDTLISVRAPVGDINMAAEDCAIGRGVAAARHKTGSRCYSFQFMRSQVKVFGRFEAEGTVFGSIGKKDFHAISCVVPPRGLVAEFERRIAEVDDRIEVTENETRTLVALRIALLPKLIAGELQIEDPTRFLGGGN